MKRMTMIVAALAMLVPLTIVAQTTVTRTVTWDAPVVDELHSEPVSYVLQWRAVGATAWVSITHASAITTAQLEIPIGTKIEARVAAVDALGRQGEFSDISQYTYKVPAGCGKVRWL